MRNLKGSNGRMIATRKLHSSESARDGGFASVKTNGPTAM
ncbi:YegP family protein [Lysobacter capsici]